MEDCSFCRDSSLHKLREIILCGKHKAENAKSKKKDSNCHYLKEELVSNEIYCIMQNLLLKTTMVNQCIAKILQETERYIEQIQHKCYKAFANLMDKQNYYMKLLKNVQKKASPQDIREIKSELQLRTAIYVPIGNNLRFQDFYETDFLKKFHNLKDIGDSTIFFANYYRIFLNTHEGSIKDIGVTSDNQYAISISDRDGIRIWNLLEKRQENFLARESYDNECIHRSNAASKENKLKCFAVSDDSKSLAFFYLKNSFNV